ncbi:DUF1768-domain-containing protein [Byssothecium circinans]|uniref:DUF1768-domain-containing protein n=1 Tax=Byssothecium circinans TaxID=147558 RepID=A0A6A5U4M5_9PLEO|nr:DUF1768-domain-containing protein [Byssothecium circinans]
MSVTASASTTTPASKPVYFWKPTQGNGYLGQWYWSPFTHNNDTYHTAEMWMMVQKARLFGDEDVAVQMLATTDPRRHKALGREVKGFREGVWDANKRQIVTEGNMHKFTISDDAEMLRGMLFETGERELVEASPMDRIWSIGYAEKNAEFNRKRWGQNLLGKVLMDVRTRLRELEKEKEKGEGLEGE